MLTTFGRLLKQLWLLLALVVIAYAILVVVARELLPVINRYQPQISAWLSEQTGMEVRVGRLSGLWEGMTPLVSAEDLAVWAGDEEAQAVRVDSLSAELDMVASVLNRSPVWRTLEANRVRLELVEDEDGGWRLGGQPLGLGLDETDLRPLYQMLFYSRSLRIDSVILDVAFYSGARASFHARDIRIENSEGFHRATATLALEPGGAEAASFVFEGRGDPADSENFHGQGYLRLHRLNLDGAINTIANAWLPRATREEDRGDMALDLEFWFDWRDNSVVNGRGHFSAAELPLDRVSGLAPVEQVSADITAWFQPGRDWGFRLQDFRGRWRGEPLEPFNLQLRQQVGELWGELDLATDYVNLEVLATIAREANLVRDEAAETLAALNPRGLLRRAFLELHFGRERPDLRLRAELEGVALDSWRGAPAVRGVDGYLDTGLGDGYLVIDAVEGFAMHYPQAYDDFMPYGASRGKVNWRRYPDQRRLRVTSNLIELEGEEGSGRAALHLDLPLDKRLGDPEMQLMVGMRNSHSRYVERFLPRVLAPPLRGWLDTAVGEAAIDEAGFIWRGSLDKHNQAGRTIQVYARVRDGELRYQPGWPALKSLDGLLTVDDGRVDAWLEEAEAGAMAVGRAGVTVRPADGGALLRVAAGASGDLGDGLTILRDSPVAERMGRFARLDAAGPADIDLDLTIPLAEPERGRYRVTTKLRGISLAVPDVALDVTDLRGQLGWNDGELEGEDLRGRLLGTPFTATLNSSREGARVDLSATLEADALAPTLGTLGERISGRAAATGELSIPLADGGGTSRLRLRADLRDLALELPEPLAKAAGEPASLEAELAFREEGVQVQGRLAELAAAALSFRAGRLERGEVRLLDSRAQLPRDPGLRLSGHLPRFSWRDWQPLLTSDPAAVATDLPSPSLDFSFDALTAGGLEFGATTLRGWLEDDDWRMVVNSQRLAGNVRVPTDSRDPLEMQLSHLRLPEPGELAEAGDGLAEQLLPENIPALAVSVDELSLGEKALGRIAFTTRPGDSELVVGDIRGELGGIRIQPQAGGDGVEEVAAELTWRRTETGQHQTRFSGALISDDLADTLAQWRMPAMMSADFTGLYPELSWSGRPWDISLLSLRGYVGLELRNGEFHRATGSATNTFFKLVSLFNFDTWLRRLRFDFSDLFSDGVSFDTVEGGLLFNNGQLRFDEPVVASMPSGQVRLLGKADLEAEQLDGRLVATMPVGTNLPWVAALVGGLPAAVGVFVTGKLFAKQVDQLSSISYRVRGSFDDPQIEVDEIFTDPTDFSVE